MKKRQEQVMAGDSEQERWSDEGPMARAVCKNADCRIETGLPLDDGSELTPAPCPGCGEPLRIKFSSRLRGGEGRDDG